MLRWFKQIFSSQFDFFLHTSYLRRPTFSMCSLLFYTRLMVHAARNYFILVWRQWVAIGGIKGGAPVCVCVPRRTGFLLPGCFLIILPGVTVDCESRISGSLSFCSVFFAFSGIYTLKGYNLEERWVFLALGFKKIFFLPAFCQLFLMSVRRWTKVGQSDRYC